MEMSVAVLIGALIGGGLKLLVTPTVLAITYSDNFQMLFEIAIVCGVGSVASALIFFFLGKGLNKISQAT